MSFTIKPSGTISLTRGDTLYARVKVQNVDDDDVELSVGDSVRFALKEDYDSPEALLTIDIPYDTMILRIAPEDTKDLPFGDYVYDVEITFENGDVDTIIPRKIFHLLEEVT